MNNSVNTNDLWPSVRASITHEGHIVRITADAGQLNGSYVICSSDSTAVALAMFINQLKRCEVTHA